jgi:hypothetical protein
MFRILPLHKLVTVHAILTALIEMDFPVLSGNAVSGNYEYEIYKLERPTNGIEKPRSGKYGSCHF